MIQGPALRFGSAQRYGSDQFAVITESDRLPSLCDRVDFRSAQICVINVAFRRPDLPEPGFVIRIIRVGIVIDDSFALINI